MGAMHLLTGLGRAHRGNRIAAQIGNNTLLFGGAGASSPFLLFATGSNQPEAAPRVRWLKTCHELQ